MLLTIPSITVCFVLGEVIFTFIIPASRQPWGYYDPTDQIARFELGQGSGVYTIGKLAQHRVSWKINNVGWNSDIDYFERSKRTKPLIAIIGDSYIEALQVDPEKSLVSVLRAKIQEGYDVYGFGRSGAPLSQYLQMSRYVNRHFDPDVLIFNVVHNDFDESLLAHNDTPYFLRIDFIASAPKESMLPAAPITASISTKLIFKSATFRYLWHNLDYGRFWTGLRPQQAEPKNAAVKEHRKSVQPNTEIYRALDYVVSKIREENIGKEVIFLIDAPRRDLYAGTVAKSEVLWMNKLLTKLSNRHQARTIDLTLPFLKKYEADHVRFNPVYDYHWNTEGHRYAAEILYESLVHYGILKDNP